MGKLRATISGGGNHRRLVKAGIGSGILVSSGYFVWQVYNWKQYKKALEKDNHEAREKHLLRVKEPEYLFLPQSLNEPFKIDPIDAKEELKSMIPKHLRKPWKLLRQANWGDYEKHLSAVRELASLKLSDGECAQIGQSCNLRTAIGLARTKDVNLKLFVPLPHLPDHFIQTSTPKLFGKVLSGLPKKDVHECVNFFTTTALQNYVPDDDDDSIADSDLENEFGRDSSLLTAIPRKRYSERHLIEYCLQALLSHSTIHSHCTVMLKHSTLLLFSKIIRDHPNDAKIKSLIGKILANLSLHEETHQAIFESGLIGVLAAWKQEPNLLVTLPATKALCNLDQEYGDVYEPGVYLLLPEHRSVRHLNELSNWGVDIVFIHGLLGGVFYSWRQLDVKNERGWGTANLVSSEDYSYCWPRDWMGDLQDRVRVIGVDFDSYISQWGNSCPKESFKTSLKERSEDILEKLKASGVGKRPVVFVGHSMGGLIIKKMLTTAQQSTKDEDQEFAKNTKGVVFYSTPHRGSHVAKVSSATKFFFFPTVEVQDLEWESAALADLQQSFKDMVKQTEMEVVSFGEMLSTPYLGVDLTFVPEDSSNPGIGTHYQVPHNHMNICKPKDRNSILYRKLMKIVWEALDEATPFEQ